MQHSCKSQNAKEVKSLLCTHIFWLSLHKSLPSPQFSSWPLNGIHHSLLHFISLTLLVVPLCASVLAPSLSPLTSFPLIPSSLSRFPFCLSVSLFPSNKPYTPKQRRNLKKKITEKYLFNSNKSIIWYMSKMKNIPFVFYRTWKLRGKVKKIILLPEKASSCSHCESPLKKQKK